MTDSIHVKGARVHNLKNVEVKIPRNKLVVVTGVSGSGKSSLAFNTLYAEGQRRYVESLSSYARQFLGRIDKPEVDFIKGIPPAIAIEQKVNTKNPRSTVGTSTEIYDYIKLLYAKIGITYSPISGNPVKRHKVEDVVKAILSKPNDTSLLILAPIQLPEERTLEQQLQLLMQQGFSRIAKDSGEVVKIENYSDTDIPLLVIDRIRVNDEEGLHERIADSVQTAFYEGDGSCVIQDMKSQEKEIFSNKFEADGITFEQPTVDTFSFNNPIGACPTCEGYGKVVGIDPDLVIPDKSLSVYEEAIYCWRGEKMRKWKNELVRNAHHFDFPIHTPYYELTEEQKELLWTGNEYFKGINAFFKRLEEKQYKIQFRVMLSRYRGKTLCPECKGTRLKESASYVKVGNTAITDLVNLPIVRLLPFFEKLELNEYQTKIAERILVEITKRLQFLLDVGLGYLTLNRLSSTLSGGESQRINLATSLGSSLVGSLYILDEPSIGLHSKDTERLIKVLKQLRDLGNTVVVVEHDEDIIKAADEIIDIGPLAGRLGGEIIFQGDQKALKKADTLTSKYMRGEMSVPLPDFPRIWTDYLSIEHAVMHNLKNLSVKFPLNTLTAVIGVSGSGKSTLIREVLVPTFNKVKGLGVDYYKNKSGSSLSGDISRLSTLEFVDQNPIGKSSRSNPVTYIKAYDEIRTLFASQKSAKRAGMKPAHFSFNVDGGRCEECQGEGEIQIEMQFMADVRLTCESCNGKRFKDEVLDIKYEGKNIYDVLKMTVEEAIDFFGKNEQGTQEKKIISKLQVLSDVGLEYVRLGQASSTLSGGESQRIKLAFFLTKERAEPSLFVFDEPTTGLHFHDINKLMSALNSLVDRGHTVIVIEHNMDVIKASDWIIELGPGGGEEGGKLVFAGTPKDLVKCKDSYTAPYLAEKLK
ncbi:excinuclease ABC subunit A [Balneicella halophila]|uniref:UvrABC system protein A n=1 Tax=Balneicella halophila TaxID=1537566 RepID=A0A7L4UNX1_BALHA|nr:excinuclease ABC subunit UvrA [Balneicella halophila]PVX50028.1 excinuclease ABC subunit A [Balneicella halophila]